MGLFDGIKAGWDSFYNNELQTATDWVKDNTNLDTKVTEYVKSDPEKATKIVEKPFDSTMEQLYRVTTGKANIGLLDDAANETVLNVTGGSLVDKIVEDGPAVVEGGLEESTQPIWERESTKKILGEDGADKLEDIFNPARWAENAIDETPLSPENKETLKKYLPIVALGAGALILLSALK